MSFRCSLRAKAVDNRRQANPTSRVLQEQVEKFIVSFSRLQRGFPLTPVPYMLPEQQTRRGRAL